MTTQKENHLFGQQRRETLLEQPTGMALQQQNGVVIPTGIPGFDESIGQGLPAENLYLVSGSIDSTSHLLVQQILYNRIISKQKVAYYTVENSSTDVIKDMDLFGMNIQKYVDEGSWKFMRLIPPKTKKVMDSLPEVPMEQRVDLDETFTSLMNNFHDTVKDGASTALHLPSLVRNFSLDEIRNLLLYMTGTIRTFGGIHFLMLTEGAHEQNVAVTIKDGVDSVFDISSTTRGKEVESSLYIQKIRGVLPKMRTIKLTQRKDGLATETIRRV